MFGPLGFIAYTDDLTAVSDRHNVHSHMYADDTQLYDSSSLSDAESEHVTPTLIQLHWLPVSYRIRFKLCCLVHAIHYGRRPAYLTETVQSVGASRSRSGLRSSSTSSMDYSLPRSSASGRSHMRVLPPGTFCPTTSAPWLILSSSENC